MPDLLTASIREKLWHSMRNDLAKFIPEIATNKLLMCCTCGRFLPQTDFDLEHLIPRQALKLDADEIRAHPDTPVNVRAGNLLLCKKPLTLRGTTVYKNGCNSWKGRFYDKRIADLVSGKVLGSDVPITNVHIIAALSLAYLAMVAEFGYIVASMKSGLLLREQFFNPYKYHRDLGARHKIAGWWENANFLSKRSVLGASIFFRLRPSRCL